VKGNPKKRLGGPRNEVTFHVLLEGKGRFDLGVFSPRHKARPRESRSARVKASERKASVESAKKKSQKKEIRRGKPMPGTHFLRKEAKKREGVPGETGRGKSPTWHHSKKESKGEKVAQAGGRGRSKGRIEVKRLIQGGLSPQNQTLLKNRFTKREKKFPSKQPLTQNQGRWTR